MCQGFSAYHGHCEASKHDLYMENIMTQDNSYCHLTCEIALNTEDKLTHVHWMDIIILMLGIDYMWFHDAGNSEQLYSI